MVRQSLPVQQTVTLMRLMIQNFILFQIGWFACVLGGASRYPWTGTIAVAAIIAIHLLYARRARPELMLVIYTIVIGTAWDSALTMAGLLQFTGGQFIDGMAPHWLIAMWALFATTLNVSMRWLKGRVFVSALLGLVGGALAYYAGHKLGAVTFSSPALALLVISIGWMFIMPLLTLLASKNDGYLLDKDVALQNREATA